LLTPLQLHTCASSASSAAPVATSGVQSWSFEGLRSWIAPRDIEEGADYPRAIMQAITAVKSMVVLLTTRAVESPHVLSEIGHAFSARKRMLPVKLVSSNLPPDFDYFLSTQQWLDASEGFTDETLKRLIEAVSGSLAGA